MTLEKWLLLPVFLQVLLTMVVGVLSGRARVMAVRGGRTKLKTIAVNNEAWTDDVAKLGRNFDNQFQLPAVFFTLVALLIATEKIDVVFVILAWAFVASRYWHSYVHTGSNVVLTRFRIYVFGFAILFVMWAWFAIKTLALA